MIITNQNIIGSLQRGVSSSPSFVGLLDTYSGAAVGYSLRRLRTAYSGDCIKVRRASDSTELDIGFVSNVLDTASLATFCSGTDGFVSVWYDQSGNGNDAAQSSASAQPKIVSGGVVELENGLPTIDFNGVNGLKTSTSFTFNDSTVLMVARQSSGESNYGRFIDNNFSTGFFIGRDGKTDAIAGGWIQPSAPYGATQVVSSDVQFSAFMYRSSNTSYLSVNNSVFSSNISSSSTTTSNPISLGMSISSTFYGKKGLQEIVVFTSDKSSDKSGINSNINAHYSTY